MTSNLLFSAFPIPQAAVSVTLTAGSLGPTNQPNLYPLYNLIGGERHNYGVFDDLHTARIKYDLGDGNTSAVDHIIIARADIAIARGADDFYLQRSADGSAWTDFYTDESFSAATLYGTYNTDYLAETTAGTEYQYWRPLFVDAGATIPSGAVSKISFGRFFDIGQDVDSMEIERTGVNAARWVSASGSEYKAQANDPRYVFNFTWRGVTDAKWQSFNDEIVRWARVRPFFLYTPSAGGRHELLDYHRVMHVWLTDVERSAEKNDYNVIAATFVEALG